ncbi:MAG: hypothetical protein ACOX5R_14280 [bacterium]
MLRIYRLNDRINVNNDGTDNTSHPVHIFNFFKKIITGTAFILMICINVHAWQNTNPYTQAYYGLYRISTALQGYYIDYQDFPPVEESAFKGLERLTTPVSYLDSLSLDVFSGNVDIPERDFNLFRLQQIFPLALFLVLLLLFVFFSIRFLILYIRHKKVVEYLYIILLIITGVVILTLFPSLEIPLSLVKRQLNAYEQPEVYFDFLPLRAEKGTQEPFLYSVTYDNFAIVWSRGPDLKSEFDPELLQKLTFDEFKNNIVPYYPTNGMVSRGDMWIAREPGGDTVNAGFYVPPPDYVVIE